jgi:outer membrane receptor protein involved in Fe transport
LRATSTALISIFVAFAATTSHAQADDVEEDHSPGYESVVTGSRNDELLWESSRTISVVGEDALIERSGSTLGDALDGEPGVHTQTTSRGAGAPIMRGQIGPGNLIVFDGIRFNNGTFRTGPNQYLNLFEPTALERIEVMRGPGGVIYGGDAIGGVLHLIPRLPAYGRGLAGRARLQFQTVDTAFTIAPELSWGDSELATAIGGSLNLNGEQHVGGGEAVPASRYEQFGGHATASYLLDIANELRLSYFGTRIQNAGRVDRLPASNFRAFDNDNHLAYLRLDHLGEGLLDQVIGTLSVNAISEQLTRHDCIRGDEFGLIGADNEPILTTVDPTGCVSGIGSATEGIRVNNDNTLTLGSSFSMAGPLPVEGLSLVWGLDAYHTLVSSEASDEDGPRRGNFSDGSTYSTAGLFIETAYETSLSESVVLRPQIGARVSHVAAFAPEVPDIGDLDYGFTGLTANARVALLLGETVTLYSGWNQGFRAPNLQETTQLGDTGATFEVPNAELGPERADEVEAGMRLEVGPVAADYVGFMTSIADLITRRDALFEGRSEIGGVPVRERFNADEGSYMGLEASLSVDIASEWSTRGHLAFTEGEVTSEGISKPARRVPPFRWFAAVRYEPSGNLYVEANLQGAAAQTDLANGDLADIRICSSETYPGVVLGSIGEECPGTPAWTTLGVRAGVAIEDTATIRLALSNLLDANYRLHGSGTPAPGFNAALSADLRF